MNESAKQLISIVTLTSTSMHSLSDIGACFVCLGQQVNILARICQAKDHVIAHLCQQSCTKICRKYGTYIVIVQAENS